jgi:hypothetical protein
MDALLNVSIPLWALAAYMVFMCAVSALPRPSEKSHPGYVWAFAFVHLLSMNLALFADPMKKFKSEMPDKELVAK